MLSETGRSLQNSRLPDSLFSRMEKRLLQANNGYVAST